MKIGECPVAELRSVFTRSELCMSQLHCSTKMKNSKNELQKTIRNANPSTHRWWIVLLVILVSLSVTNSGIGPALVAFVVPRDYALCSRSHDIYTVDETQPRVECIAVEGSWILDAGDQGQYFVGS